MSDLALRTDVPVRFAEQMQMAEVLAESNLLPAHLRGKPANVLLVLSGARALGIPAFWALQSLHVIEGKLGMDASMMRALVTAAGHTFRVVERTRAKAVVEIQRHDRDTPYRCEFTADDAKTAELHNKSNWKKYPQAMLVARATSIAVRDECPEVLFGVQYTPDELGAITDDEGQPVNAERIIQMPEPDKIQELADALVDASFAQFPAAWQAVIDLGWALEKIPGMDSSLRDYAACVLAGWANAADTLDEVKAIWNIGRACHLMEIPCEGIPLHQVLKERGDHLLNPPTPATDDPVPENVVDGEVIEPGCAPEIDTDNARALREQAAATWGDDNTEENTE